MNLPQSFPYLLLESGTSFVNCSAICILHTKWFIFQKVKFYGLDVVLSLRVITLIIILIFDFFFSLVLFYCHVSISGFIDLNHPNLLLQVAGIFFLAAMTVGSACSH